MLFWRIVPEDDSDAGGKQAANGENFGRQLGRKFKELFDNRGWNDPGQYPTPLPGS
jgi:hypothetical protein